MDVIGAVPKLLTIEEAAATLGVSIRTLERMSDRGKFQLVYVGRLRRVRAADVLALASSPQDPAEAVAT